jgi:hypothetical protein
MTPNFAVVHIANPSDHWRGFKLWIPLFLLWIPVILLSPLILLGMLVFAVCAAVVELDFFQAVRIFWDILCSLPGTNVHVRADGKTVLVRIL